MVVLVLFSIAFYYRNRNLYQDLTLGIVITYILSNFTQTCGCLVVLITLYTCRKTHLWQKLYKNVNILDNDEQQCHIIITAALFVQILLYFYKTFMADFLRFTHDSIDVIDLHLLILVRLSYFIHFFYKAVICSFSTIIILEIKRKLSVANEQLNLNLMNIDVTAIHTYIYQAIEGGKTFNRLFGYRLLIFYFQWFLFIVMNLVYIITIANPKKYTYIYHANTLENLIYFVCDIIIIAFGPFAIVFACDMVAKEVDKFIAACYEIEEKFHYTSIEYHELQSLTSILGNGVVQFTAAKFIEIKRTMMLSLMTSAITYFIALVEFY
ncbi:hypothetical protein ABEB36_013476 [Hypothenemus hampei]|uniref:Gustatory receptor n=1 Tax=Hypothenemus hampei TaxID=57062 RepID=A0ABD1E4A4_HYPHA